MTTRTLSGGCLCARVRYTVTLAIKDGLAEAYYCHCRMCQLAVGNVRAAFINVAQAEVQWSGAERREYASSRFAWRGFCGHCGTPLSFRYEGSAHIDLTVGSLDDPGATRPVSHFAIESRVASWHVDDDLPGARLDGSERLVQRWAQAYGPEAPMTVETARSR